MFERLESDRVPVNYLANHGIDLRLKKHFRLKSDDELLKALNIRNLDLRELALTPFSISNSGVSQS